MTLPSSDGPRFGYLLVHEGPDFGWIGGCLLVTEQGRPTEFHCTEPILPSRAEEILYGDTLREHLAGERIAPALLSRVDARPDVLFVTESGSADAGRYAGLRTADLSGLTPQYDDLESERLAGRLAEVIDLAEPFDRVREAIVEAQRMIHEGARHDDRAA